MTQEPGYEAYVKNLKILQIKSESKKMRQLYSRISHEILILAQNAIKQGAIKNSIHF